ncbi:hypothetical protein PV-S19_0361 [Pacmanvirus S19]|nr:hypothetical protein PV-S19_0361 [Pacmanvirus S19]
MEENKKVVKKVTKKATKKVAKKKISKALRTSVWDENGGKDLREMNCYIGCGSKITFESFECGHDIAEAKGGKTELNNLFPICPNCNKSMGTKSIDEFRLETGFVDENFLPINNAVQVLEYASRGNKESNTPFEDGEYAELNSISLNLMGITTLNQIHPRNKEFSELEKLKDLYTLGELLHKYRICNRSDLHVGDKKLSKILKEGKSIDEIETNYKNSCMAKTKKGESCSNKVKEGNLCQVHLKK